ncbi:MAG TPA: hypothetical protein PKV86_02695, partial [Syntrophobacteraceae bacterium]|nr:hypothetical protein [Syntrophobacteraceae bacterium]
EYPPTSFKKTEKACPGIVELLIFVIDVGGYSSRGLPAFQGKKVLRLADLKEGTRLRIQEAALFRENGRDPKRVVPLYRPWDLQEFPEITVRGNTPDADIFFDVHS